MEHLSRFPILTKKNKILENYTLTNWYKTGLKKYFCDVILKISLDIFF